MSDLPSRPARARGTELRALGRRDRPAARESLSKLSPEEQALLVGELRPAVRGEFLMLVERPEEVVPLLQEQEFVATILSGGMSEASWLLEIASSEQRVACVDLDCWSAYDLDLTVFEEWIDALIEAGRPTLVKALNEIDPEVWVLAMRHMADVAVVAKEEDAPTGWFTEDGVCYFHARSDEAFARVKEIAQTAFSEVQPCYWQLVYGMLFELESECQEYALRWRSGRLKDLGFPDREQAMQAYRPLSVDRVETWDLDAEEPDALVPFESLPELLQGTLTGRALSQLTSGRAADLLGYVLAVANSLAVADGMSLSDADSIPTAMHKALNGIDQGLRAVASAQNATPERVLDRTRPLDLFRIGATLDPEIKPVPVHFSTLDDYEDAATEQERAD